VETLLSKLAYYALCNITEYGILSGASGSSPIGGFARGFFKGWIFDTFLVSLALIAWTILTSIRSEVDPFALDMA